MFSSTPNKGTASKGTAGKGAATNIPPVPPAPPKPRQPPRSKRKAFWDDWSLTSKLVSITMILLLLSMLGTSAWTLNNLKSNLMERNDERLIDAYQALALDAASEIFGTDGQDEADPTPIEQSLRNLKPAEYYVQFYKRDGGKAFPAVSDGGSDKPRIGPVTENLVRKTEGKPFTVDGTDSEWRVLALPVDQTDYYVAIAIPLDSEVQEILDKVRATQIGIGLIALALAGAIGWLAISSAFKPLRDIEKAASAIAAGDLSKRVATAPADTELGRLSSSLNTMLGQIETAFQVRTASESRMRRFVADASHELRTPLVTIRGYAELYRQGAITKPDDIGAAMSRIENEAKRMGGLVEDLVMLARLDEERPSDRHTFSVNQIAIDAVADAQAQSPDRDVELVGLSGPDAPATSPVHGDEAKIRQVVTNLMSNAIRHTPEGSPIELAVGIRGNEVCLEVRDHGEGLTEEQVPRVFERFYRLDASRNRDTGGSGLGLSIAAAIVAAHHGSIDVAATEGGGATFRVMLPSEPEAGPLSDLPAGSQTDPSS
ncbi:HAMP domain-containing sensor histidine kinase [Saxibacter everestensis]|uniref:histidine kinase n=1 Tax=Saxibacter everestensis TaxID=2909229 RepID=A0ABY8QUM3_9MICO|nr:HAMP domain-containing sensor histidine kinase [Brevibacteriaceae bacterium ZFBP1038]